jgi:hypothetical protein
MKKLNFTWAADMCACKRIKLLDHLQMDVAKEPWSINRTGWLLSRNAEEKTELQTKEKETPLQKGRNFFLIILLNKLYVNFFFNF